MSSLKNIDINNETLEKDWPLLEKYMQNLVNNTFYYELLALKNNMYITSSLQKEEVITTEYYYTTNKEDINNIARVTIVNDRKVSQIELIKTSTGLKDFITSLSDYLIQNRNLKDIFVFVHKKNERIIKELIEKGFISLATKEDDEYIPLLLERENKKTNGRHI